MSNIALKSSAGSGKTYALAKRFLSLYLRGAPLSSLYGITFTNKATLEMKERVIHYLDILYHDNPVRADEIEITRVLQGNKKLFSKRRKELMDNLSSVNISTFDSLFTTFLSTLPFEAGVLPGYDIIEEIEEAVLLDEVLDRFLEEARKKEDYSKAIMDLIKNDERRVKEQLASIYQYTRGDINFIKESLGTQERIERDFAERERLFRDRLNAFIGFIEKNEECIYTKSGHLNKNMVGFLDKLRFNLDEGDFKEVGLTLLDREFLSKRYFKNFIEGLGQTGAFHRIVDELMDSFDSFFISLSDIELFLHMRPIWEIDRLLKGRKLNENLVTFDDIERLTERALRCGIDYLYFKVGGSIDHLMIDEFQDTSIRQWEILRPIVSEIASYSGGEKSLFYVGDTNQALYRWREGEPRLFDFVKREYQGKIIEEALDLNYRSKTEIVDFVNGLFQRSDKAQEDNRGGWVRIESLGEFKTEEGREFVRKRAIEVIKELTERGYEYSDIAILVRRNSFGVAMTDLLEDEGIPCVSESKAGVFSREDTRTLWYLLKFLEYPEEDFSLSQVLLSPFIGMRETALQKIKSGGKSLYLSLVDKYPESAASKKLQRLLSRVGFLTPHEIIYNIYTELNLPLTSSLVSLLEASLVYSDRGFGSLSTFIDWLELMGDNITVEEGVEQGVNVLTIHKAKGLEFPVVIIPDTVWRIQEESRLLLYEYKEDDIRPHKVYWSRLGKVFPKVKEASYERVWEDEKKVLYVAVTRAIEGLYILGFDKPGRNIFNFVKETYGSPFSVGEIVKRERKKKKEVKERRRRAHKAASVYEERELYSPTERGVEVISADRKEKMELGDVVHRAFSKLEWIDGKDIRAQTEELIDYVRDTFVRKPEDEYLIDKAREILQRALVHPDFSFAFEKGEREVTLKVEIPVYFEKERRDVSIKIDRLLVEPNLVTIIDFKTGDEKVDDIAQIRLYKDGMKTIFPQRKVEAYLLYLEKGAVRRV